MHTESKPVNKVCCNCFAPLVCSSTSSARPALLLHVSLTSVFAKQTLREMIHSDCFKANKTKEAPPRATRRTSLDIFCVFFWAGRPYFPQRAHLTLQPEVLISLGARRRGQRCAIRVGVYRVYGRINMPSWTLLFFPSLIWTYHDGARQLRRGAPRRRASIGVSSDFSRTEHFSQTHLLMPTNCNTALMSSLGPNPSCQGSQEQ